MGFHHTWICLAQSLSLAFCCKLSVRFMCSGYLDDKCQRILRMSVWVVPLFGGVCFLLFYHLRSYISLHRRLSPKMETSA